ncbi:MAG: ABC transporter ATP-binding protein [Eubacterium sp.]|nr:ABC transporter ATP-binding protein [Eubacterium sp.]
MLKIFKFMYKYIPHILLIVLLLIIQAWGDLTLPQYTSDIVDVGIQQGGVPDAAAEALTEHSANMILLFLDDDGKQLFNDCYELKTPQTVTAEEKNKFPASAADNVYFMTDNADERRDELNTVLASPMMMLSMISSLSYEDFLNAVPDNQQLAMFSSYDELTAALGIETTGAATAEDILLFFASSGAVDLSGFTGATEQMPESILIQGASGFVREEYVRLGADTDTMQRDYLIATGIGMLGVTLIMMTASIIVGFFASRVSAGVGFGLRGRIFRKVVSFSGAEIEKFSTASLITRSTNDIMQIQMVTVMILRMVLYAPILGIGGIFKVLSIRTDMAWIIGIAVLAIFCVVIVLMVVALPKFKIMQSLVDRLNLVAREILTGLPVIRAFSRERHEEKRFDEANARLTRNMLFTSRTMTFMMPLMMLIMNLIAVLIVWIGAGRISEGNLQVGEMIAFITYTMQIVMSFLMLTMISVMLPRAAVSAERIDEVLNTEPSITDTDSSVTVDKKDAVGEVCFDNVSFRYPDADMEVLKDISFTAKPGETTAFIGSTGSGKSTLVHLLPRFYDVTAGKITVDGKDIRDISVESLRDMIGFVPQKGVLFSGTIKSNLRFGDNDASDELLQLAADISQSSEFISQKPDKFDEPVSQGGTNVSGGQKQRLSIARAIVRQPKIYIFDDSFSALDYKTDVALRKALAEKTKDCTVMIVAQRISTILHAEQIIVLDEGRIAGKGTHEQLMESCEVYRQIATSQLSESDLEKIGGER